MGTLRSRKLVHISYYREEYLYGTPVSSKRSISAAMCLLSGYLPKRNNVFPIGDGTNSQTELPHNKVNAKMKMKNENTKK